MFNRPLVEIHTADIHFGAFDPKTQYEMLMERMINKIRTIHFDAFFINGDLFHHKFMSNSDVVMYALLFIDEIAKLCMQNDATLVLLHGTYSHDADQLKLFYRYINSGLDIRIVEQMRFEEIKGTKVLCIPEEYNRGKDYYENLLYYTQDYDMAVLHGNIKGAIYGLNAPDLNSQKSPVFSIEHFARCNGPIICGHVHIAKCLMNHIYYCGSPLRWQFGEEQEKGFIVCVYDPRTHAYYNHFEIIESFRYDTIDLDSMINATPESAIQYIKNLKANGIDYIKIRFSGSTPTTDVIKRYFSNSNNITIDVTDTGFINTIKENQKNNNTFSQYAYILSPTMSEQEIFTQYVNQMKGEQFITVQELEKILSDL